MCNSRVSDIPIVGPLISKPARLLPMAVSAIAPQFGIGPTMGNLMSIGTGAGQGMTTGLYGQPGMGSAAKGGIYGMLEAPIGRGIGGAISPGKVGLNPNFSNQPWKGFQTGLEQSIPFKNALFGSPNPITQSWNPTTQSFMSNYYSNPPAGSAVAGLKSTMSPQDYSNVTGLGKNMAGNKSPTAALEQKIAQNKGAGGILGNVMNSAVSDSVGGLMKNRLTDYLAPAAFTGLGMMQQNPPYDIPSAVDVMGNMRSKAGELLSPITPEGKAAASKLTEYINNPQAIAAPNMDSYKQAIGDTWENDKQRELSRNNAYHSNNGTYGGSDWQRDQQEIAKKYDTQKNVALGDVDRQIWLTQVSAHLDSISNAYQMEKSNLESIAGLTNMSIMEAATKYGLKVQEVNDFRQALYALAASSFPGTDSSSGILSSANKMLTGGK